MVYLKLWCVENISGDIFVDNICIDCDICCWMLFKIFYCNGVKLVVYY